VEVSKGGAWVNERRKEQPRGSERVRWRGLKYDHSKRGVSHSDVGNRNQHRLFTHTHTQTHTPRTNPHTAHTHKLVVKQMLVER